MENLVQRLRRTVLPVKKWKEDRPAESYRREMERMEGRLAGWTARKGWRVPHRTLGEAAAAIGTDSAVLHHYFEERMGVDFRTWRTRLRLEDAKRMLIDHPELQAAEIGRRAGFSNRSNFARQFLSYTGLTPGRWREKAWISPDIQASQNDYVQLTKV